MKKYEDLRSFYYGGTRYDLFIYGELRETNETDGIIIANGKVNGKTGDIINIKTNNVETIIPSDLGKGRFKEFNMGWALCASPDVFDHEIGVKIAKRRFSKYPLKTQNGRFLTNDMVRAIIVNEMDYIEKHIEDFIPEEKKKIISNFKKKDSKKEDRFLEIEIDDKKQLKKYIILQEALLQKMK